MRHTLTVSTLTLALLGSFATASTPHPETDNIAKYVAVNIEIKELSESGSLLKEASKNLSRSLNSVSDNIDDLSPEQLILIIELAEKMNGITRELNTSLNSLPSTIQSATKPSSELLGKLLKQVEKTTIEPVVSAVHTWLLVTIVGLCILAGCLLIAIAICMRHIGKIGLSVKSIADGYRIIPLEQYKGDA